MLLDREGKSREVIGKRRSRGMAGRCGRSVAEWRGCVAGRSGIVIMFRRRSGSHGVVATKAPML